MERSVYQQLAEVEDSHWWFVYRRKLIAYLLERSGVTIGKAALDIGCGTGGNLPFLKNYCTEASGIDLSRDAIELARKKYPENTFVEGNINDLTKLYSADSFDIVSDFSVLCHGWVKSDLQSMRDVYQLLRPGGTFVLTEPAFSLLRRAHDRAGHAVRRYTLPQLTGLLAEAGFRNVHGTYFNAPMFPIVLLLALSFRLAPSFAASPDRGISELKLPPNWINDALVGVMSPELAAIRTFGRMPLGVSIACVARKP
jgi:SAM-dependent methyltransferase